MDFHGQHIVVTGGSSGIGLVTARLLAGRGARVSLIARRKKLLDEAVAAMGEHSAGFAADVGDKAQLDGAIEAAAAHFGPVHGLFANAGLTGGFTPAVAFDPVVFEETIRVNLISVFWAIQKVLPAMIEARNGVILVTGSMACQAYCRAPSRHARDPLGTWPRDTSERRPTLRLTILACHETVTRQSQ